MGECSEVSVIVGACVSVGMVNLLKKWPLRGGHVTGSTVMGEGVA